MLTLDATTAALVASDNKTIRWSIRIFDKNGIGYGYYTDAIGATGWAVDTAWIPGVAWFSGISNDVVIMDFDGIELRRNSSESGLIAPSEVTFSMSNPENTYTFTDFKGGTVFIELFLWNPAYGERKVNSWKFNIKSCEPGYQKLRFTCEDFLQKYLRGDYPNTRIPEDIFKSDRNYARENICIPVPFGTAYVPLRDVYIEDAVTLTATNIACVAAITSNRAKITGTGLSVFGLGNLITISGFTISANNGSFLPLKVSATEIEFDTTAFVDEIAGYSVTLSQNQPFFMLGDTTNTYTITKIHAPKEQFGDSEWPTVSELRPLATVFPQSTHADSNSANWRLFQALIADDDDDGVNENAGFFVKTPTTYDPIVQFTRSDTVSITNPADVIAFVQKDMGIPAADIDEAVTYVACHATFDGLLLAYNGAFWYKQSREKVLSSLLNQCHSCLDVGDTLQLRVLSKISKATITSADIIRTSGQGEGSFGYRDLINTDYSDSVYVAWQESGQPQDSFLKVLVACDAAANVIPKDILECPFVQDSQDIQRIGRLFGQRKYGKEATISFQSKSNRLALQPDDVITISGDNYGGTYDVLIDSVKINKDGSINFSCTKFINDFDDWSDISPTALTIPKDDTSLTWQPTISGPQTDQDIGRSAFTTWGKEYLTVGPIPNAGAFTDIQKALNAVNQARGGAIYILNGDYQAPGPLYIPDVNLEIIGQSQGGVVLKNLAGSDLFVFTNLTKTFNFHQFTYQSQNVAAYSNAFYIDGTSNATSLPKLYIENVAATLKDSGKGGLSTEDSFIRNTFWGATGYCLIKNCSIEDGNRVINFGDAAATVPIDIKENTIIHAKGYAISYYGAGDANIFDNILREITQIGIYASGTKPNISRNKLYSSGSDHGNTFLMGIRPDGAKAICKLNELYLDSTAAIVFYGIYTTAEGVEISDNLIYSTWATASAVYGINLGTNAADCIISMNKIVLSDTDTTANHYGIYQQGDRGIIAGNHIDLVNNDAKDIGINLPAGADNNQGGDNVTYRAGTGISDSGTGNAVTGQDV